MSTRVPFLTKNTPESAEKTEIRCAYHCVDHVSPTPRKPRRQLRLQFAWRLTHKNLDDVAQQRPVYVVCVPTTPWGTPRRSHYQLSGPWRRAHAPNTPLRPQVNEQILIIATAVRPQSIRLLVKTDKFL